MLGLLTAIDYWEERRRHWQFAHAHTACPGATHSHAHPALLRLACHRTLAVKSRAITVASASCRCLIIIRRTEDLASLKRRVSNLPFAPTTAREWREVDHVHATFHCSYCAPSCGQVVVPGADGRR